MDPVTGFHSVIERPDSVSLVRPPNTTMPKIKVDVPINQYPTDLGGTTSGLAFGIARVALAADSNVDDAVE